MNPPIIWIESTSWEPAFFGLPQRVPWPADTDPAGANREPFEMEHLLRAIRSLGAAAGEPWISFERGSAHLEDLAEAIDDSDIVHAGQLLDLFEQDHPGTAFALFHRGALARLEGRNDDAAKLFHAALEKAPKSIPVWNNLGVLHAMRGERDLAVAAFRKTIETQPHDRTALEGLAQLRELVKLLRNPKDQNSATYVELPQFEKIAAEQLQRLGNDPDQLLNYGEQLLRDGLAPEQGFQALEKAHALRPDHRRTVFAVTAAYRLREQNDQALAAISAYTKAHPDDAEGFFHLAQVCSAKGDSAGEIKALDCLLAIDPNAQAPLGIRFALAPTEHNPAKEQELAQFGAERGSWMAYILASNIARQRADSLHSVKWAERAYQLAPESEDVLLHYTAALGEARDFEKLVNIVKQKVETGKFSKRLDWNYAQVLQQTGLTKDAISVLRKASAGDAPEAFKTAAETMIDAWSGVLSGCGVQLEVHSSGFLQRPIVVALDDGDGGIVLNAGSQLPSTGSFPWRVHGPEVQVPLQQGQTGGGLEPRGLGAFLVRGILPTENSTTIDCHVVAQPDGALHFRATQDGKKLPVGWAAAGVER
jgi:tetratricopeptide (TPR) repeat protein